MDNNRYILQVRFKDNEEPHWIRTWCIMEYYKTARECEEIADGLLDSTVDRMRIVDSVKNEVYKRYK